MKLLLIDVGNTQTVVGVDDGDGWHTWRLSTQASRTADEWELLLHSLLGRAGDGFQGAALSSVVPSATVALRTALYRLTGHEPVVVGPGTRTGMQLRVDNPREVGADRIVNALGAVAAYGAPVVTVDFGTATTVDLIGPEGDYRGGAIAPGILVAADALVSATAALRRVDVMAPPRAVGRSTVEAIQSGLVYGYAGLVDGLLERILSEIDGDDVPIVATGGLADVVIAHCRHRIRLDENLTLRGLKVAWERNR
ncbi:MAG TPA: type III pantothenate kinase [Acidimicrobiia bacterium]|nr:type III pantothenate kinase [Acidimicrobiia bacterium]